MVDIVDNTLVGYSTPYLQVCHLHDTSNITAYDVGPTKQIQLLRDQNLIALGREHDLCICKGLLDG